MPGKGKRWSGPSFSSSFSQSQTRSRSRSHSQPATHDQDVPETRHDQLEEPQLTDPFAAFDPPAWIDITDSAIAAMDDATRHSAPPPGVLRTNDVSPGAEPGAVPVPDTGSISPVTPLPWSAAELRWSDSSFDPFLPSTGHPEPPSFDDIPDTTRLPFVRPPEAELTTYSAEHPPTIAQRILPQPAEPEPEEAPSGVGLELAPGAAQMRLLGPHTPPSGETPMRSFSEGWALSNEIVHKRPSRRRRFAVLGGVGAAAAAATVLAFTLLQGPGGGVQLEMGPFGGGDSSQAGTADNGAAQAPDAATPAPERDDVAAVPSVVPTPQRAVELATPVPRGGSGADQGAGAGAGVGPAPAAGTTTRATPRAATPKATTPAATPARSTPRVTATAVQPTAPATSTPRPTATRTTGSATSSGSGTGSGSNSNTGTGSSSGSGSNTGSETGSTPTGRTIETGPRAPSSAPIPVQESPAAPSAASAAAAE